MNAIPRTPRDKVRFRFSLRGLLLATTGIGSVLGLIVAGRFVSRGLYAAVVQRQIASIRAAGDPVSFADLEAATVSQVVNAAYFLDQAEEDLAILHGALGGIRHSDRYRSGTPTVTDLTTIRSVLQTHAETMALLEQASRCAGYHAGMNYAADSRLPPAGQVRRIKSLRAAAAALEARSQLQACDGQLDQALKTCIVSLRLARLAEQAPLMPGYLGAVASRSVAIRSTNRVLRSGEISGPSREDLDAELALHDRVRGYEWMLKTERVLLLETYDSLAGRGNGLTQVARNREQAVCLKIFAEQLALSTSTYDDFRIRYSRHRELLQECPSAGQTFPAVNAAREAMSRVLAETRCLRLLNALQRGSKSVDFNQRDLTRLGLPRDALFDPFDGQQLRVKKLPDGWVVYSVGRNGQDDGGIIDPFQDVGVSPCLPIDAVETQ